MNEVTHPDVRSAVEVLLTWDDLLWWWVAIHPGNVWLEVGL